MIHVMCTSQLAHDKENKSTGMELPCYKHQSPYPGLLMLRSTHNIIFPWSLQLPSFRQSVNRYFDGLVSSNNSIFSVYPISTYYSFYTKNVPSSPNSLCLVSVHKTLSVLHLRSLYSLLTLHNSHIFLNFSRFLTRYAHFSPPAQFYPFAQLSQNTKYSLTAHFLFVIITIVINITIVPVFWLLS